MEYNVVEYKNEFNSLYLKLKELRDTSKNLIAIVNNSSLGYIATKYADFVIFTEHPYEISKENYIYLPTMEMAIEMGVKIINPKDTLLIAGKKEYDKFVNKLTSYKQ